MTRKRKREKKGYQDGDYSQKYSSKDEIIEEIKEERPLEKDKEEEEAEWRKAKPMAYQIDREENNSKRAPKGPAINLFSHKNFIH